MTMMKFVLAQNIVVVYIGAENFGNAQTVIISKKIRGCKISKEEGLLCLFCLWSIVFFVVLRLSMTYRKIEEFVVIYKAVNRRRFMFTMSSVRKFDNLNLAYRRLLTNPESTYKNYFRNVYTSYAMASNENLKIINHKLKAGYIPNESIRVCMPKSNGLNRMYTLLLTTACGITSKSGEDIKLGDTVSNEYMKIILNEAGVYDNLTFISDDLKDTDEEKYVLISYTYKNLDQTVETHSNWVDIKLCSDKDEYTYIKHYSIDNLNNFYYDEFIDVEPLEKKKYSL